MSPSETPHLEISLGMTTLSNRPEMSRICTSFRLIVALGGSKFFNPAPVIDF